MVESVRGALTFVKRYFKEYRMTLSDVTLLLKKIVVGIIVTLIPFLILFGGLWLTQKLLNREKQPEATIHSSH